MVDCVVEVSFLKAFLARFFAFLESAFEVKKFSLSSVDVADSMVSSALRF